MRRRPVSKKIKLRVIITPRRIGGRTRALSEEARQFQRIIPKTRLNNLDLQLLAKVLKIRTFRGVFMLDEFPNKPWKNERAIFNLDKSSGKGTHWVCYKKIGQYAHFFDSSGADPPPEFVRYMKNYCRVSSNKEQYQKIGTNNCGQLCLLYLLDFITS